MLSVKTLRFSGSAAVLVALLGALTVAAPAALALAPPSTPGNIHVASATPSSFSVAMDTAANTQYYRVYASTTLSDIYVANISRAHASPLSTSPQVTVSGLAYAAAPYFYRVETLNGPYHAWTTSYQVGLQPAVPTSVTVSSTTAGTWVNWASGPATGAVITQATDAALTQNRRDFVISGTTHTFTPYGMTAGGTYYYRVRARTVSTASPYSAQVSTVIRSHAQGVRVMTYNITESAYDGIVESGQAIAPWSQRRAVVAGLVKQSAPDVLAIQEGETFVGPQLRQVDSLAQALGSPYVVARTEVPPTEPGYYRSGCYVIYNSATFSSTGHGGFWTLPYSSHAAYVLLRSRVSGSEALFVSPHFVAGGTVANDSQREAQMKWLTATVHTYAAALGNVPVIYAGDFNSHERLPVPRFDGVAAAAAAVHIPDAKDVAQYRYNAQYNSANGYSRTAPMGGYNIDHIYAPPGIAVATWHLVANLQNGQFTGVMGSDHNPLYAAMSYPY